MTSWRDEHSGGRFPAQDPGQPVSRRAAREAERRAAETMVEKPPHPSGVVDFEAHDFSAEFAPDQDFAVGDTQDIWQALTRGGQGRRPGDDGLAQFRSGIPEAAPRPAEGGSAMPSDLLDRVRESVLRRRPEEPAVLSPAPHDAPRTPPPAPSRRDRRRAEPADEAVEPRFTAQRPEPQPVAPQPSGFAGYDYEDDGYYDEPYAPEPTIAIAVRQQPESRPTQPDPVALHHGWAAPAGDDALTFSSPIPQVAPQHGYAAEAEADPEFLEPEDAWDDEDDEYEQYEAAAPAPAVRADLYRPEQVGPPSEVTDLAGFEEMIRLARQQTPAAPAPTRAAPAWMDEEEVQEGFTGLLSRQVQGSHGSSRALILPSDPQPLDVTQAVSGTGDIFVTGTMQLSRNLSTTGVAHDVDSPDLDRLYDTVQDEPAAGVEPVRASRAVSTAPNRAVVGRTSRRGNVLPTVLAIVAAAMAVGVVTLLVGSWALRLF